MAITIRYIDVGSFRLVLFDRRIIWRRWPGIPIIILSKPETCQIIFVIYTNWFKWKLVRQISVVVLLFMIILLSRVLDDYIPPIMELNEVFLCQCWNITTTKKSREKEIFLGINKLFYGKKNTAYKSFSIY